MKLDRVPKSPDYLRIEPKSGYFWYDIYRKDRKPQRLCRSTGKKVKTQAIAVAEKVVAKWLGEDFTTGEKTRLRFRDVANDVLTLQENRYAHEKIRLGTLENARLYIDYLKQEFGNRFIDEMAPKDWDKFVAWFRKENPSKILYSHWKHMAQVMGYAFDNGYIKKPWKVENPDPRKETGRVLTEQEKTALLEAALPNLRDQLIMAMTMGMRQLEHLHLAWDRVNFEDRTITLRPEDTKTKKGRVMKMSPQVYDMLVRRKEKIGKWSKLYVFPARGNSLAPVQQNKSAWNSAKTTAKIRGRCRYHDLRHTYLSECAALVREGKVSIAQVCQYAGLSIRVFERVYLHMTAEMTAPVADLIAVSLRYSKKKKDLTT